MCLVNLQNLWRLRNLVSPWYFLVYSRLSNKDVPGSSSCSLYSSSPDRKSLEEMVLGRIHIINTGHSPCKPGHLQSNQPHLNCDAAEFIPRSQKFYTDHFPPLIATALPLPRGRPIVGVGAATRIRIPSKKKRAIIKNSKETTILYETKARTASVADTLYSWGKNVFFASLTVLLVYDSCWFFVSLFLVFIHQSWKIGIFARLLLVTKIWAFFKTKSYFSSSKVLPIFGNQEKTSK